MESLEHIAPRWIIYGMSRSLCIAIANNSLEMCVESPDSGGGAKVSFAYVNEYMEEVQKVLSDTTPPSGYE